MSISAGAISGTSPSSRPAYDRGCHAPNLQGRLTGRHDDCGAHAHLPGGMPDVQEDREGALELSMDEERYWPEMDPRKLLPFTCQLEPDDPNVQRLPSTYVGTDDI